jgi:divalent metal cation (Fe/Co/Zn/Cd) transporter
VLALALYGGSGALLLFGAAMAWSAMGNVAGGRSVLPDLLAALIGLAMVVAGVLLGRVAPRVIRRLSGTDAPPAP